MPTAQTIRKQILYPADWDDAIRRVVREGEGLSEFVREAIRREIRRRDRAIGETLSDPASPGRPWPPRTTD